MFAHYRKTQNAKSFIRQSKTDFGLRVKKASESNATVGMLLPARTDTKWFHDYIYNKAEIRFIKGRLKFGNSKNSAPFPSMVAIFRNG